jgi:uncharacterized NAD-dependent epimerase/dehydratase family protein
MCVGSGTHQRVADTFSVTGRIFDFRYAGVQYPLANGKKRRGIRILTVSCDGVVGKKFTALSLSHWLDVAGVKNTFCATGQTGRLLRRPQDRFVIMDTTPIDFGSGAAEWLSPDHEDPGHVYVVEGQAGIFHPAWGQSALSVMLGSQPDALIYCVDLARDKLMATDYPVPDPLEDAEEQLMVARKTNPNCMILGFSLNTSERRMNANVKRLFCAHNVFDPSRGDIHNCTDVQRILEWVRAAARSARAG